MSNIRHNNRQKTRATPGRLVPTDATVAVTDPPYHSKPLHSDITRIESTKVRQLILRHWRFVLKWHGLILVVAGVVIALGTIYTLMQRTLYTATVRLQIDEQSSQVLTSGQVSPASVQSIYDLRTLHQTLKSRSMAERVVAYLNLANNPSFLDSDKPSLTPLLSALFSIADQARLSDRKEMLHNRASAIVMDNRRVRPSPGSRMVDIAFSDPNPELAAVIANAFGKAFIDANMERNFKANSYAKRYLEDRLRQLKSRLEGSEKLLLDFAEKRKIPIIQGRKPIAESNLAGANAALEKIVSTRIKTEQQWRQAAQIKTLNTPQFLSNSVIDGLRSQRKALITEYQEKLETFKPGYPAMVRIKKKIAVTNQQLAAEVETIRLALKAAFEASSQQEQDMKNRVTHLRGEVLDLQKRSVQYNILQREVDTNRKLYNGLLRRYKEVDIAAGVGANNILIIDRAAVPNQSSSPRLRRAVLLAIALGLALGLGLAVPSRMITLTLGARPFSWHVRF